MAACVHMNACLHMCGIPVTQIFICFGYTPVTYVINQFFPTAALPNFYVTVFE